MGRYYSFIPFDHLVETCMKGNILIYDTSFYFHFHFKPLKTQGKNYLHLISCSLLRRIREKFNSFSCFNSFQIQYHKKPILYNYAYKHLSFEIYVINIFSLFM